jgi:hypothetical protein
MTSQDVVEGFLNSFRRPLEADPDQRWINSFNTRAMIVSKYFKWLAYPDLKQEEKNRMLPLPPALKGLRFVRKKGPKSRVKNADLWTLEEDAIFLKYCEDPRTACYHAMARCLRYCSIGLGLFQSLQILGLVLGVCLFQDFQATLSS